MQRKSENLIFLSQDLYFSSNSIVNWYVTPYIHFDEKSLKKRVFSPKKALKTRILKKEKNQVGVFQKDMLCEIFIKIG